ncbi:hypothetical protein GCM10027162_17160 [Streptomyces incanus]
MCRREGPEESEGEQHQPPGAVADGRVREQPAQQVGEGRVGPGEQCAEDEEEHSRHDQDAQCGTHVAGGVAGPGAHSSPAPPGALEQRVDQPEGAEDDAGPGPRAVEGERGETDGGGHGEERRPQGGAQRRNQQEGDPSDAPGERPGASLQPACLARGEVRGERGRQGDEEQIDAHTVVEERHAEHAGGECRPQDGGAHEGG